MSMAAEEGGEVDDTPIGHLAPPWLPDSAVSMCQLCSVTFTVTRRRHHCRACGMVSLSTSLDALSVCLDTLSDCLSLQTVCQTLSQ